MSKKVASVKKSAASGRFVTKSIGRSKAAKFAAVEGLGLNGASKKTVTTLTSKGLRGDAYRNAVTGQYKTKSQ